MVEDLFIEVETLKNLLVSRATGGYGDPNEYRRLRDSLLKNQRTKGKLPRFVKTCRSLEEFWGYIKQESGTYQGRRDFLRDEFDDILSMLENESLSPSDEVISTSLVKDIDFEYVQAAWQKALDRREGDPEGAITMTRTLLETVCKHIMDESNYQYEEKWELPQFYKGVQNILNLAPNNYTEEIFKQILGGCTSIVTGLGSLRNKLSDAHGRSKSLPKPSTRHAQLAVNLAGAMAQFLITSWAENKLSKMSV